MLSKAPEYENLNQLGSLFSALIRLKDETAVLPLLALIDSSEAPELRSGAITAVSVIADPRALDAVLRLVESKEQPSVRMAAITGLGGFADTRATGKLLAELNSTEASVEERRAAATALYKQGQPAARDGAGEVLRKERDVAIRISLILLFGHIGWNSDIELLESLPREDATLTPSVSDAIAQIRRREAKR